MIAADKIGLLVGVGLLCLTEVQAQDTLRQKSIQLIDTLAIKEKKEPARVIYDRSSPLYPPGYGRSHAQPGTAYVIEESRVVCALPIPEALPVIPKKPTFFRKAKWFIQRIFN